jgi:hypothetical protein
MVYLGVEDGTRAHRMLNPSSNKIVVSRDVVFEEAVKWSLDAAKTEVFSEVREDAYGQFVSRVTVVGVDNDNDMVGHGFD